MKRRSFVSCVSSGAVCAMAGCVSSGCRGIEIGFRSVDAAAIASQEASSPDDMPQMMAELAIRSAEGGEPTVETTRSGPLSWLTHLERAGEFYEITEKTIDEGAISGPGYVLSRDRETGDRSPDDALSFDDLPRHDQWRVNEAADFGIENLGQMRFSIPFVAGYLDAADQDASILAAGTDAPSLEANGSIAELKRTGEDEDTARQYRYTAELVSEDVDSFSEYVLARRGAPSFDPSGDVRTLLDEATENDGHVTVCNPSEDEGEDEEAAERRWNAAKELDTMLRSDVAPAQERPKYVRYEGDWYEIDVSHSQGGP